MKLQKVQQDKKYTSALMISNFLFLLEFKKNNIGTYKKYFNQQFDQEGGENIVLTCTKSRIVMIIIIKCLCNWKRWKTSKKNPFLNFIAQPKRVVSNKIISFIW